MPRIRRWFHVSHDINSDPEVWELTDRFGDRALRVWMQMLSIADTNNGRLKGRITDWVGILLGLYSRGNPRWQQRDRARLDALFLWMAGKGWIAISGDPEGRQRALRDASDTSLTGFRQPSDLSLTRLRDASRDLSDTSLEVVNYWKYNPRRDTKEYPLGKQITSPPILSSPILSLKTPKRTLSAHADRALLNGFGKLWETYPEPRGPKAPAFKAYKEKNPPPEAVEALAAQIDHKTECDRRNQFWPSLPHLVRWIKQERWTDEIPNISLEDDDALDREIKRIRRDIHGDKETD